MSTAAVAAARLDSTRLGRRESGFHFPSGDVDLIPQPASPPPPLSLAGSHESNSLYVLSNIKAENGALDLCANVFDVQEGRMRAEEVRSRRGNDAARRRNRGHLGPRTKSWRGMRRDRERAVTAPLV